MNRWKGLALGAFTAAILATPLSYAQAAEEGDHIPAQQMAADAAVPAETAASAAVPATRAESLAAQRAARASARADQAAERANQKARLAEEKAQRNAERTAQKQARADAKAARKAELAAVRADKRAALAAERAERKAELTADREAKRAAVRAKKAENRREKDARYRTLFTDNGFTYYLDMKNSRWVARPNSASERIIEAWVRLVENTTGDAVAEDGKIRPAKYFLEHYYISPERREIMFISELEVTGRPENGVKERPYDNANWEQLVPGSIEDDLFETITARMKDSAGRRSGGSKGMSLRDMVEEFARISL